LISSISVVVITSDTYQAIAPVIRYLQARGVREQMAIPFYVPTRALLGSEYPEWKDFASVQVLELGPVSVIAPAKADRVPEVL
jgi:hypothetical protein